MIEPAAPPTKPDDIHGDLEPAASNLKLNMYMILFSRPLSQDGVSTPAETIELFNSIKEATLSGLP